jgi:hypothetical protein
MLFASSPSCQGPSLRTLSLNVFVASLSFHHFVLGASVTKSAGSEKSPPTDSVAF